MTSVAIRGLFQNPEFAHESGAGAGKPRGKRRYDLLADRLRDVRLTFSGFAFIRGKKHELNPAWDEEDSAVHAH